MSLLRTLFSSIIILLLATACQQSRDIQAQGELPTLFILSTDPPATSTASVTSVPTATLQPTVRTPSPKPTNTPSSTPTITITPLVLPTLTPEPPTSTRPALPERFTFGRSVQGRDLSARRIGEGEAILMLVGGIHGGAESNTVTLIEELQAHFENAPGTILPGIALVFVPQANPDGISLGRTNAGRFNANGVDLNRNWACGWQQDALFRDTPVNPGSAPFSEPETIALAALINDVRPAAVLFYHSAADGIYAGRCNERSVSEQLAAVLGEATGYPYGQPFTNYPVTGTAPAWVDGLGIPAVDVELATANGTEFERNLRGVMALQCWLTGSPALPACR